MKVNLRGLGIATVLLVAASNTSAESEPTALVDQQRCMFCHKVDIPFRAPSFQQIAARYRGMPGATAELEDKLRLGGRAHWGNAAMPSAPNRGVGSLSRADAHLLVRWVLSQ